MLKTGLLVLAVMLSSQKVNALLSGKAIIDPAVGPDGTPKTVATVPPKPDGTPKTSDTKPKSCQQVIKEFGDAEFYAGMVSEARKNCIYNRIILDEPTHQDEFQKVVGTACGCGEEWEPSAACDEAIADLGDAEWEEGVGDGDTDPENEGHELCEHERPDHDDLDLDALRAEVERECSCDSVGDKNANNSTRLSEQSQESEASEDSEDSEGSEELEESVESEPTQEPKADSNKYCAFAMLALQDEYSATLEADLVQECDCSETSDSSEHCQTAIQKLHVDAEFDDLEELWTRVTTACNCSVDASE